MGEEMGEEELLALILKEHAINGQCKDKLEKYCQSLKNAGVELGKVHEKVEGYCKNGGKENEEKCTRLETKIQEKCTKLENELKTAPKNKPIENEDCVKYELKCLFLEGACPTELTGECNELRNECYEKKRNEVAEEIALRALKGGLKQGTENQCENELKKHCPILGRMSQELMEKCLNPEEACKSLITEAEKKCASLKDKVKDELEDIKDERCLPLLEECYFYGPNCEEKDKIKTNCEKLKTQCENEHDIVYTPPEQPWFPIQPRVSIVEEVGLEGLYKAIAKEGILINKLKLPSIDDLLFFLSQKKENGEFDDTKCKAQEGNCDYLKTLSKELDYNCTNIENECDKLKKEFDKERKDLEGRIKETKLFSENNGDRDAKTISWHKLYSDIYGRNCAQLQSDCFFLSRYNNKLTTACDNVQAMCYKRGLDVLAYETLESQMRGEFHDSGENWPNNSQKKLVEVCKEVRNQSYHLLELCLHPEKTYLSLFRDIQMKVIELDHILDIRRDSPEEDDCLELEPKCDRLKEEDTRLLGFCHTLERNCYHLRETQNVRNLLLEERQNYFENIKNCTSILGKKCQNWLRKVNKQFKLSCALQSDTCTIMTSDIILHCENLIKNINESNIVTELNKADGDMDKLRKLCPRWMPYCDALLPSCAKELAEKGKNDTLCPGIQKLCQPYQARQAVENAVFYEFRGNLNGTDTCNTRLEKHCVTWTETKNNTFSSLCNDINDSKKGDKVKELCERLVKKVKKLCKTLPKELNEEEKELTERVSTYEKLKKKAEDATKGTNVILTFSIKNNSTDKTNNSTNKTNNSTSHALVKRSEHHPTITEKEAEAFDLVAIVVTEYVDLKEKCEKLRLDCGFKECTESQDTCSKIEKSCNDLKQLEIKPPQTITNTETSTSTVTEKVIVDSEGKTICTSGAPSINMNCTSIHTTDTWVTHTSTHTSTKTQTSTITSKVTIVSTKKCQPTQCTTDRTHPTHTSGGEEAGEVKPSGGIRVNGWGTSGMILMILFSMICF
uniref:Large surface protein PCAN_A1.37.1 n=1 Tax=Pneumocystis canis TaxID=2698477 RepID=A0A7S5W362_9ASCO|nr:large surface protein PCAN_A1.37.1 [Pneumocystis canis]